MPTPTPKPQPTKPGAPTPSQPNNPPTPTRTRVVPPTRTPSAAGSAATTAGNTPEAVEETADAILANAGGSEYTSSAGEEWQGDQEYVAGETAWGYVLAEAESGTFEGTHPISGTKDSSLYQDERWAMAGYRFDLPNGRYQVTLGFAEQFVTRPGRASSASGCSARPC